MTTDLVGYEKHIAQMAGARVVLLTGPEGVGKRTLCEQMVKSSGAKGFEQMLVERLDMEAARHIIDRCQIAPMGGVRAVALNANGVSEAASHALLKTLEEGHPATRFYMYASAPVLGTIRSRATVLHRGPLSDVEVYKVCRNHGMSDGSAYVAARLAKGIPATALKAEALIEERGEVLKLLRAVSEGNQELLSHVSGEMDSQKLELLRWWVHEATTKRWALFDPGESFGLEEDARFVARARLIANRNGSPRLLSRAALWMETEHRAGRV